MNQGGVRDGGARSATRMLFAAGPDPTDVFDWRDHFAGPTRRLSGEQKLMFAVLGDALHILVTYTRRVRNPHRVAVYVEALAWLEQDDLGWPFSFRNVCVALDIDPERLRDRVQRLLRPRHVAIRLHPWAAAVGD